MILFVVWRALYNFVIGDLREKEVVQWIFNRGFGINYIL